LNGQFGIFQAIQMDFGRISGPRNVLGAGDLRGQTPKRDIEGVAIKTI